MQMKQKIKYAMAESESRLDTQSSICLHFIAQLEHVLIESWAGSTEHELARELLDKLAHKTTVTFAHLHNIHDFLNAHKYSLLSQS